MLENFFSCKIFNSMREASIGILMLYIAFVLLTPPGKKVTFAIGAMVILCYLTNITVIDSCLSARHIFTNWQFNRFFKSMLCFSDDWRLFFSLSQVTIKGLIVEKNCGSVIFLVIMLLMIFISNFLWLATRLTFFYTTGNEYYYDHCIKGFDNILWPMAILKRGDYATVPLYQQLESNALNILYRIIQITGFIFLNWNTSLSIILAGNVNHSFISSFFQFFLKILDFVQGYFVILILESRACLSIIESFSDGLRRIEKRARIFINVFL